MTSPEDNKKQTAQGVPTATESRDNDVFPFFDLPRKLRNKIYVAANRDLWIRLSGISLDEARLRGRGGHYYEDSALLEFEPYTNPLRVNRQFNREYEEETAKNARLTIGLRHVERLMELLDPSLNLNAQGRQLEKALSRINHLLLTHRMHDIVAGSMWEGEVAGLERLGALLNSMPSLKRVSFIYLDNVEEFKYYPPYNPPVFTPANVHRLIADYSNTILSSDVEIQCSVILTGLLVCPSYNVPRHFYDLNCALTPTNHIVYHMPSTLDPKTFDPLQLDSYASATDTVQDIDVDRPPDDTSSKLVLIAGHRTKIDLYEYTSDSRSPSN